ncbi:MAG: hypothetical protein H7Y32_13225, partial [Chloroflexales bacterium]|nr:hypothetical protein [Chloroflexales bacterium]
MLFHRAHRIAAFTLLALLALLLSGCAATSGLGAPTGVPAATLPAGQPTAAPAATQPASQPTAAPVATRPTFAFEPRQGGPGTTISMRGWGFAPNAPVKLGVGFPTYTGGALGTASANAGGEWQA